MSNQPENKRVALRVWVSVALVSLVIFVAWLAMLGRSLQAVEQPDQESPGLAELRQKIGEALQEFDEQADEAREMLGELEREAQAGDQRP